MGIGSLGWSPIKIATVTLTDSQIQTLPTIPVEIVAAPGSGKMVLPLYGVASLDWTANYTNINTAARLFIATTNAQNLILGDLVELVGNANVSGLLAFGADALAFFPPRVVSNIDGSYTRGVGGGWATSDFNDDGLSIGAANGGAGNFTDGDPANTLKVTVYYTVVDL